MCQLLGESGLDFGGFPGCTPITFIIVPVVNNRSAPGQKHGNRGKSAFFHQIIFRTKSKFPPELSIFCGRFPENESLISGESRPVLLDGFSANLGDITETLLATAQHMSPLAAVG